MTSCNYIYGPWFKPFDPDYLGYCQRRIDEYYDEEKQFPGSKNIKKCSRVSSKLIQVEFVGNEGLEGLNMTELISLLQCAVVPTY
uniref:Uncharacterized protein n=1 Tax=Amphimedon queenslandica TaxID=400682 RepID=A0A1X7VR96_AMPQE